MHVSFIQTEDLLHNGHRSFCNDPLVLIRMVNALTRAIKVRDPVISKAMTTTNPPQSCGSHESIKRGIDAHSTYCRVSAQLDGCDSTAFEAIVF